MPRDNEDKMEEVPGQKKPELIAKFDLCPVCSLRQAISDLVDLMSDYAKIQSPTLPRNVMKSDTHRFLEKCVKLQEQLDVAAHPATEKFAETLAKEAKEKGHMAPEYEFYTTVIQGPVRQQSWEPKIPFGASIIALWVGLDTCMKCGTVWGLKLVKGVAIKPAIPPGGKQPPGPMGLYRGRS